MPHTNEEIRDKIFKLWKGLRLEDKTSFEEIPAIIQIENLINQEISDLKKSIREEIALKGEKGYLAHKYKAVGRDGKFFSVDEILSLKSLE